MAELALAWILRRPEVTSVITGASKPEQVCANAQAAGQKIPADVLVEIDGLLG